MNHSSHNGCKDSSSSVWQIALCGQNWSGQQKDPLTIKPVIKFTHLCTHGWTIKSEQVTLSLLRPSPNSHVIKGTKAVEQKHKVTIFWQECNSSTFMSLYGLWMIIKWLFLCVLCLYFLQNCNKIFYVTNLKSSTALYVNTVWQSLKPYIWPRVTNSSFLSDDSSSTS